MTGRSVTEWPVGLTVYEPDKCCEGYTLFCPLASPAVYLMDVTGEVVHMWLIGMGPGWWPSSTTSSSWAKAIRSTSEPAQPADDRSAPTPGTPFGWRRRPAAAGNLRHRTVFHR